jgi:hypothetical protein
MVIKGGSKQMGVIGPTNSPVVREAEADVDLQSCGNHWR